MCISDAIYKGVRRGETDVTVDKTPSYEVEQETGEYAPNTPGVVHQYF